jgi:hypothetical protein
VYRWLRNTHLVLGLLAFPFLLMYGASAVQMAHPSWFSGKAEIMEKEVQVSPSDGEDGRSLARALMGQYGLRGELHAVTPTDFGYRLEIGRPGTEYEIEYSAQAGKAKIRTSVRSFMLLLNRIHHIAGLRHQFRLSNAWGTFVIVVSIALILLSLTGIYLWFHFHSERRIGTWLLGFNLVYSLVLIVLIRIA